MTHFLFSSSSRRATPQSQRAALLACVFALACSGEASDVTTVDEPTVEFPSPSAPALDEEPGGELPLGGQTGAETGLNPCETVAAGVVADADSTFVGFSVDGLLADVRGQHAGTFEFADGVQLPATLSVERAPGEAQYVQSEPSRLDDAGAPANEADCSGRLHVPIRVRLTSDDPGANRAFDETLELLLVASSEVEASASLPLGRFGGFDLRELDLAPEQSASLLSLFSISSPELRLEISGVIHTEPGNEPRDDAEDLSLAAAAFEVGAFRAPLSRAD